MNAIQRFRRRLRAQGKTDIEIKEAVKNRPQGEYGAAYRKEMRTAMRQLFPVKNKQEEN